MNFEYPHILWLIVLPVLLAALYVYREIYEKRPHLRVSTSTPWLVKKTPVVAAMRHLPFLFKLIALVLIILALARPRSVATLQQVNTEGIDIVLAMDISGTMLAEDLRPNRLEAAKRVAIEFIVERPNDNIGLVVFAGESFTQCPLTTDHAVLINY